jgi:adenylate cyclase
VRARTAQRLRRVASITLIAALVGAAIAARYEATPASISGGLITGTLSGLVLACLEIVLRGSGAVTLRRLPVAAVLALRTTLYCAVFFGAAAASGVVARLLWPRELASDIGTLSGASLLLSLLAAFAINFVLMLQALLGGRTFAALVTGRYHRPQLEERIVLFLDLKGSTSLGERLGDTGFHRFLNQVFVDVADPVLEAGGEIYRYVGDEIIITWGRADGTRDAACVNCLFAIEDALASKRAEYKASFGAVPRLRGGLHLGSLIVGEMGDLKREIVLLGDTMNTTSRIEGICRATGRDYIASGALVRALPTLPSGVRMESLGTKLLRGKESGIELFALSRG